MREASNSEEEVTAITTAETMAVPIKAVINTVVDSRNNLEVPTIPARMPEMPSTLTTASKTPPGTETISQVLHLHNSVVTSNTTNMTSKE